MTYYCSNCGVMGKDQLVVMVLAPFEQRCNRCLGIREVRSCRDVVLQFQGTTLQKEAFLRGQNCDSCDSRFKCYTQ